MQQKLTDITEIHILCGGGLSSVYYNCGILYALDKTGKLFDKNNKWRKNIKFQCVSGSCIPALLLNYVVINRLYNQPDWFKKYITNTVNKLNANLLSQLYIVNTIKSYLLQNKQDSQVIHKLDMYIIYLLRNVVPIEIQTGKRINFSRNMQFDYIYILDNNTSFPDFTNDLTVLNELPVTRQIAELIQRCTIFMNVSYLQPGFTNDPGPEINNIAIDINKYTKLKYVYFSTLYNYDEITNENMYTPFNLSYYITRLQSIREYRNIKTIKDYCVTNNIVFTQYALPNKYHPIRKFNNNLYNELVPYMFYSDDFTWIETFLGYFITNPSGDILQILFLFGAFETLNAVNISHSKRYKQRDLQLESFYNRIIDNCVDAWFWL